MSEECVEAQVLLQVSALGLKKNYFVKGKIFIICIKRANIKP